MKRDDPKHAALDALLDADRPDPTADFDARVLARLGEAGGEALEDLLDGDRPEPSADFDARFFARLGEADAPDARLDRLLESDRPEPSADFDGRFFARLAEAGGEALDDALDADRPEPSPGFDDRVRAAVAAADAPSGGARILRFVRRPAVIGPLLALAAALVAFALSRPADEPPPAELGMLAHLDLLEVYDEMEVLDGIADEETFDLVAMLHTLDEEEPRP